MKVRWSPVLLEENLILILEEIINTCNYDSHLQVSLTSDNFFEEVRPN